MSKKLQDAQTFNIHVVPEDFLKEIQTDRPTIVMEKLKISSWGILPHIRKQNKTIEDEKIKSGRSTFGSLDGKSDCKYFHFISISISFVFFCIARINKSVPDKMKLKIKDGAAVDPESGYNL